MLTRADALTCHRRNTVPLATSPSKCRLQSARRGNIDPNSPSLNTAAGGWTRLSGIRPPGQAIGRQRTRSSGDVPRRPAIEKHVRLGRIARRANRTAHGTSSIPAKCLSLLIILVPQTIPLRYKSGASLWPPTFLLGACSSNARLIRVMGRMRSRVVVTRSNPVVGAIGVFLPQDGGGALLNFLPVHVDSEPQAGGGRRRRVGDRSCRSGAIGRLTSCLRCEDR